MLDRGQRVYHEEFGWGTLLSVKQRPGTKTGNTGWVKWETHTVSRTRGNQTKNDSSVYLSSLSPERAAPAGVTETDSSPPKVHSVTEAAPASLSAGGDDLQPDDVATATPAIVPAPAFALPEEIPSFEFLEGAIYTVTVNAYERDPEARRQCIAAHGCTCCVCGFSFGSRYGQVAEGYIHVHHLRPLSEVGGVHLVDPVEDLRPVCPNCHAVLHRRVPSYSIEEVRAFLR
jgi:HNH endonuclease